MELVTLGQNLAAWRELTGLTQAELAQKTEIPRATLSLFEAGRSKPKAEHLEKIARAFGVGLLDVVKPPRFRIGKVRFRSSKPLKSRNEILAIVARKLAAYSELERLVGEGTNLSIVEEIAGQISGNSEKSPEFAAGVARRVLELDEGDKQELIRDLCGLLEERAGIKIIRLSLANPEFFGLSVRDPELGPAIVVNTWERISIERQLFTLAHEFGHIVLHASEYDPNAANEEKTIEDEANRFAGYFLMPTRLFEKEYREAGGLSFFNRVLKIKRLFRVSYKAVIYRLEDHYEKPNLWGLFQKECMKNIGKTLKKSEEPAPCTSLRAEECEELGGHDFIPDRLERLVFKALAAGEISISRAAEILEMDLSQFRDHYRNIKTLSLEQIPL